MNKIDLHDVEIYNTGHRRGVRVTHADLDAVVAAHEHACRLGLSVPVKVQHSTVIADSRVVRLRRREDTLLADLLGVPEHVVASHPWCSAETMRDVDFAGRRFLRALTAVSLTDRPGCWGLADVHGVRRDEIVVRPTGEHGFESFVVEREDAVFAGETLLPCAAGDAFEIEAQFQGVGAFAAGLTEHDMEGNMKAGYMTFEAFWAKTNGERRTVAGRVVPGRDCLVSPTFKMTARESRVECEYISITKIQPSGYVKDKYTLMGDSAWLWFDTGTYPVTSFDLITGSVGLFTPTAVGSEFGVMSMPQPNSGNNHTLFERPDPGFHPEVAIHDYAPVAVAVNARVFVSSAAVPVPAEMPRASISMLLFDRNRRGIENTLSLIVATAVFSHGGPNDFDRWVNIAGVNTIGFAINPVSYPPPYFASFGVNWWPRGTPSSFYLQSLNARVL